MQEPALWRPKPWIALLLGVIVQPLGMLYVQAPRWAAVYFCGTIAVAIGSFVAPGLEPVIALIGWLAAIVCALHCWRLAKRAQPSSSRAWFSRWPALVALPLSFFAVAGATRAFLFEPFRNSSASMYPTMKTGSNFMASKWGYGNYRVYGFTLLRTSIRGDLHRGDVVVFENPLDRRTSYVKRLVGLPGDVVEYRDKALSINGKAARVATLGVVSAPEQTSLQSEEELDGQRYKVAVEVPVAEASAFDSSRHAVETRECAAADAGLRCVVPSGHYFMLGDNRDASADSRYLGSVPAENIVGVVRNSF